MKITSVDVFQLTGNGPLKGHVWRPVIVRINTDEGISGFGEVGLSYGTGSTAGFGMVKDMAQHILDQDPINNEMIWESLFRNTFWGMGGGTVVFGGISGIDMALWDIKGKAAGMPVYKLLGGKSREKLRAYAAQIQFGWDKGTQKMLGRPEEYAETALKAVADGYDCLKVDPLIFSPAGTLPGPGWNTRGLLTHDMMKMTVDRVSAIRDAVGPAVDIIVEMHAATDTNTAIQVGRALEGLNIFYYEEPVHPLNVDSMQEIARSIKIPVATGERIYGRWGFREYFEKRAVHIIQPDLGLAGGITECKKISDMANTYDIAVQCHNAGSPISIAATLQLEAAIPNYIIHEHHVTSIHEDSIGMCKYDYQPKNGRFEVPELPGIGQELSDEAMEKAVKVTVA
jgi:L-alanine-DL-glutamate epimerase and related enzymes of enolase superfamily